VSGRHEWELPTPENTAILEQLLRDIDEEVDLPPPKPVKQTATKATAEKGQQTTAQKPEEPVGDPPPFQTKFKINLKRMREREAIEEVFNPAKRRKSVRTTPS